MTLLERFLDYVKIDSQSDPDSSTVPSTAKQLDVIALLVRQLKELGVPRVVEDGKGNVYATIPGNDPMKTTSIGLMAHVDTATEMSGKNVRPQVITNYDGGIITLSHELGVVLDPTVFPSLTFHRGKTLVTTSGDTLLGADDKAGVAILMDFVQFVMQTPSYRHGPIQIGFTCDEEIGRGVTHFDPALFQATFAYTLDGGDLHRINVENFNASSAVVRFQGKAIHPGSAKNQMVNAQTLAARYHLSLPTDQTPETTEGYEGFIHLTQSTGGVESAELRYILRNHDLKKLEALEALMQTKVDALNSALDTPRLTITIQRSYYNMKSIIDQHPDILKRVNDAYQALNLPLYYEPIRGGTDGAMLTYKGVPTPNLATGGYNFHGKYEYFVVEDGLMMVEVLKRIFAY
jgi:tripeptide aminopeptidase